MTIHVIGGGVAGLAAAIESVRRGQHVILYEASPELGGRARTYFSSVLECRIDNGAHAVLRNNAAVQDYLVLCGSQHELTPHGANGLTFYDVRTHQTSRFAVPSALWSNTSRPHGISFNDLAAGVKLFTSSAQRTAADALRATPDAVEKLWEPLCTAALNTPLVQASAEALGTIVRQMALPGGLADGLLLPRHSLSSTYVAPTEQWLIQRAEIERGIPLRSIEIGGQRITALIFDHAVTLDAEDVVILALPPWSPLLQAIGIDTSAFTYAPIVNAHFRLSEPAPDQFTGLIGGCAQWLWVRNGIASVTVSAADELQSLDASKIAAMIWAEIAPLLAQGPATPAPAHVIKERRATLRHTPGLNRLRPGTRTNYGNLFLAGDWVVSDQTRPLPCTLESALQSGFTAAKRAADGSKHA